MAFIEFETALKAFHGFSANNFRNWFLSFFIHLRNAEDVYWKIVRETQLLEIKFPLEANVLRAGDRNPVLRLRQGYGACTLLAVVFLSFSKVINKLFYPFVN